MSLKEEGGNSQITSMKSDEENEEELKQNDSQSCQNNQRVQNLPSKYQFRSKNTTQAATFSIKSKNSSSESEPKYIRTSIESGRQNEKKTTSFSDNSDFSSENSEGFYYDDDEYEIKMAVNSIFKGKVPKQKLQQLNRSLTSLFEKAIDDVSILAYRQRKSATRSRQRQSINLFLPVSQPSFPFQQPPPYFQPQPSQIIQSPNQPPQPLPYGPNVNPQPNPFIPSTFSHPKPPKPKSSSSESSSSSSSESYEEDVKKKRKNKKKDKKKKKSKNRKTKSEILTFDYTEDKNFDGIINYLTMKTGGNIHDNGTIEVTSNDIYDSHHPKNMFSVDKIYAKKTDAQNAVITFDFKEMEIEITAYSIQSYNNGPGDGHLKNWAIEVSKDGEKWTQIDERSNSAELNGSDFSSTFRVSKKLFTRFCRLRQTGEYWGNNVNGGGCHLIIRRIEFYGKLKKR